MARAAGQRYLGMKIDRAKHELVAKMGFSDCYLRALAWRDDFGSESYWAVELGKLVAARPGRSLRAMRQPIASAIEPHNPLER